MLSRKMGCGEEVDEEGVRDAVEEKREANWEVVGAEVPPKMNGEDPAEVEGAVAAEVPVSERQPGEVAALLAKEVSALVPEEGEESIAMGEPGV